MWLEPTSCGKNTENSNHSTSNQFSSEIGRRPQFPCVTVILRRGLTFFHPVLTSAYNSSKGYMDDGSAFKEPPSRMDGSRLPRSSAQEVITRTAR